MKKAGRYLNGCAWAALLFLALLYWTPLANRMAEPLTVAALEQNADAIVVLSGGVYRSGTVTDSSLERVVHGITLYHRKLAPRLILTGGNPRQYPGVTEAGSMGAVARSLLIPSEALLLETASGNTHENALEAKRLLEKLGAKQVLLVTTAIHMKRALGAFRAAGVDVYPAAPPRRDPYLKEWDRVRLFMMCMHEYAGIAWYRYKGWYRE